MVVEIGIITKKDSAIETIVEWSINDFLSQPHEVHDHYWSPVFSIANIFWYFNIWPNRARWYDTEKSLELSLFKYPEDPLMEVEITEGPPMEVEITFGGKTVDGKIDYERHFTRDFNAFIFSNSYFMSISELVKRKSDLLPSNTLTLVCRVKRKGINEAAGSSSTVPAKCTYCNKALAAQEDIQCHLRKCEELLIHCQNCSSGVTIKNWHDHKCQKTDREGFNNMVVTKCSYCHKTLGAEEDIQTHLQECEDLPIKCRKCNDRVALRNWYEHECQMTNAEGKEITPESSEDFHRRTDFEFILAA